MEKLNPFTSKNKISHFKLVNKQVIYSRFTISSINVQYPHRLSIDLHFLHLIDDFLADSDELYLYSRIHFVDSILRHFTSLARNVSQWTNSFPPPSPCLSNVSTSQNSTRVTATFHCFGISPPDFPNNRINIISSGWIDDQTRSPDNCFHPRRARFRITRQLIATMAAMDPSIGRFN